MRWSASTPTLVEQVAAVSRELGLDDGLTLVQKVNAANTAVGVPAEGPLADQVRRLVVETGARVDVLVPLALTSVVVLGVVAVLCCISLAFLVLYPERPASNPPREG